MALIPRRSATSRRLRPARLPRIACRIFVTDWPRCPARPVKIARSPLPSQWATPVLTARRPWFAPLGRPVRGRVSCGHRGDAHCDDRSTLRESLNLVPWSQSCRVRRLPDGEAHSARGQLLREVRRDMPAGHLPLGLRSHIDSVVCPAVRPALQKLRPARPDLYRRTISTASAPGIASYRTCRPSLSVSTGKVRTGRPPPLIRAESASVDTYVLSQSERL